MMHTSHVNWLVSTRNQGKLKEIEAYLLPLGIQVLPLPKDAPEVEETGETFEENARLKAESICKLYQMPVLADDSGLVVDLLNGEPGVRSARYAGETATDEQNLHKLLLEVSKVKEKNRVTARFISQLALARPGFQTLYATGICEGFLIEKPRGSGGFGYDPIFVMAPEGRTLAEMSLLEKNQVSHRALALEALVKELRHESA